MTKAIAVLPMYDRPELCDATDRLWACLARALRDEGIAAPEALTRGSEPMRAWLHPRLVLGQTCGLPFVRHLAPRVTLIGAPDYGVPGCPPGYYRSAIVVRRTDAREDLEAFRGAPVALNGSDSQSGYAALLHHVMPQARAGRFFGAGRVTGSHAASARCVAEGAADIAAIDYVSWRSIQRFDHCAAALRVLALTEPTPALPYIAAAGADAIRSATAAAAGIAALDAAARRDLGLDGFRAFKPADYRPLATRLAAAEAMVRLDLAPPDHPRSEH